MSRSYVTSPPPEMVPGFDFKAFSNPSGSALLFDFAAIGQLATALAFIVRIDSGSATFTPEASYWPIGPADVSPAAPQPFTVSAGQAYFDPYGVDTMRPYWRLWVNGTAAGVFGVERIPR